MSNPSERYFVAHNTRVSTDIFIRNLLGRKDIQDALKRLDSLIQMEGQMAQVQTLKVATETKDGTLPYRLVTLITLNARLVRLGVDKTNRGIQQMSDDVGEVKRDVEKVKCP